ncbi:hypothetical protein NG791_22575 [Laspinema sp. D1]|uniref:hypothetical protein n=1 Tax=Laspinema palackyanum TaxID=3231601 RepID=UPI003492EFD3|nr:hypothetical protein [Laspinema sp. D2b]
MANYQQWNQAIASYFTSGIPRGTRVYLSVDDDILDRIGGEFDLELNADTWGDDFRAAVTKKVIVDDRLDLQRLQSISSKRPPPGIAFLGLCVLAASEMAEEDEISDRDYFRQLRKVLGLSDYGRPPGMEFGDKAEEPLWKDWNRWLSRQRFESTAHRGPRGPRTYINYPISQALLRRTDKDRLRTLFAEKSWSAQWDDTTLLAHLCREAQGLSKHLKNLLESRERYKAVAKAIHEVYEQWRDEGCPPPSERTASPTSPRHLFAGLYRTEVGFCGQVDYCIYPKQIRGRKLESLQVQLGERVEELTEEKERPGWYYPLAYSINWPELERGARYRILDSGDLRDLILPQRDFWLLIPDPDNPKHEAYANWGKPPLESKFILLCKRELLCDLKWLRNNRLLEWSGEPQAVFPHSSWVELQQCQVISTDWDDVFVSNSALKDALQPTVRLFISLSGGLRVPGMKAWLEGHGPQVTLFGSSATADLTVTPLTPFLKNRPIRESQETTNTPISVNFPSPGEYQVTVTCMGKECERSVEIIPWSDLSCQDKNQDPTRQEWMPIGSGYRICGSVIQPVP